jgi:uncharacterized protein YukE
LDRNAAEADKRHKETERVIRELSEQMKENDRNLTGLHEKTEQAIKNMSENIDRESAERYKGWERAHEETERAIKNMWENMDRRSAEREKEWERSHEEIERVLKNLSENIGGVNNSIGKLVETLIAARLWEKFADYGLQRAHRRVTVHGDDHRPRAEIDIVLTNTDCAIAVEVKREFDKTEDVDRHLERMELIRQYPPAVIKENSKRVMGAVAGGVVSPNVMEYAHKRGLFVLELSGESVRLAPAPAGFAPRVW